MEQKLQVTVNSEEKDNTVVTWESSNPEIVSVSPDGVITGISNGEATITAKSNKLVINKPT